MIKIWTTIFEELKAQFPNIPIISAFGNNDNFINYTPVDPSDPKWGGKLYQDCWRIWFESIPANYAKKSAEDISRMKNTFETGGWMRYDFDDIDRLSTLIINSNYFADKKHTDQITEYAKKQI